MYIGKITVKSTDSIAIKGQVVKAMLMSHVSDQCARPQSTQQQFRLKTYFKACTLSVSAHDFCPLGLTTVVHTGFSNWRQETANVGIKT